MAFNHGETRIQCPHEPTGKSVPSSVVPGLRFDQILFGLFGQDQERCQRFINRSRTSDQGRPLSGFASYASSRRSGHAKVKMISSPFCLETFDPQSLGLLIF